MPFGYHGCVSSHRRLDAARAERVPLAERCCASIIGGSGLGVRLLLDEGAAAARSAVARRAARLRLQPAGRQPAHHLGQVCRGQQEPADRAHQRFAGQQRLCGRRQGLRLRRHRHRRPRARAVGADHRRRAEVRRALESGRRSIAARPAATPKTELRARLGADYRIASIGPAGEHAVRYATISHDGRHAGRGGSGAVLGAKNIKAIAVRGNAAHRVGASARADGAEPRLCRSGRSVRRRRSTASSAPRRIC